MPRKKAAARGSAPAATVPHRERKQNKAKPVKGQTALAKLREQGVRFKRPAEQYKGIVLNRAKGPLPVRLEAMLAQHGPPAMTFLCDTVNGKIPGMTNQQRLDAATTITTLLTQVANTQIDAFAQLIGRLDLSELTDEQIQALHAHQHDAQTALQNMLQMHAPIAEVHDAV